MLAFARVALIRLVRDRTNVFFVILFPVLIVLLVGMQFGGAGSIRLAVVDGGGPLGAELRAALEAQDVEIDLVEFADADAARAAVADDDVDAAVVVPAGVPSVAGGDTAEVAFVANPDGSDIAVRAVVEGAVAAVNAPLRAQRALVSSGAVSDVGEAGSLVADVATDAVAVRTTTVGDEGLAAEFAGLGQFDLGASSQLLLFVFITSMTGSAAVVQAKRWGIVDRVLAGPTSPGQVIAGLGLGQLAVAGVQAIVIVVATSVLFGVNWGDPVASSAVVVLFALVSAAAGLLLGALLRNEEQTGGVGVPLSLGLAALGGSMLPLELLPPGLRTVANLTPHAWGNEAFAEIVRRDGTLVDVLPELGVLALFSVVLWSAASWTLRRRLHAES